MMRPVDHLAFQARFQPDRLAMMELASGREWRFAELDRAVQQTAALLRQGHGIGRGDRVAALARNCAELLLLHFACARVGAIYVPLNWRLASPEIAHLIEDAEPALVVAGREFLRPDFKAMPLEEFARAVDQAEPLPHAPIDPDRPSLILFTSGTSGRAKGALLSERNLWASGANLGRLGNVSHVSRFLIDSPMFHIIGLVTNVRAPLYHGGAVLISDGFDAARTLARMADPALGVTHYFCVPQMASMLRQQKSFNPACLAGLTAIFTGGAPHPAADIRTWLDDGIAVVDGYGMSETGTVFGMPLDTSTIAGKAGSVGFGTPMIEARIVDDAGQDSADGTPGELLLRGENVFSGYWRRREANEAAFAEDGWFRTGDVAVRDSDGFYTLVDRKKDMFISGGENVYPAEVESAMAGFEGIAELAVIGVPDQKWGEVGHLVIVAVPGVSIDRESVFAYMDGRLARYKIPKHVTFADSLPRTGSGKVMKAALRHLLPLRDSQSLFGNN
jgi:fatty-acyl-CoA synthase